MRLISSFIVFVILSTLSSCVDNKKEGEKQYHIGVSQCSSGYWRDKLNNEMQRELLLHDGITMELRCAEDEDKHQIDDIQYFIDEGVDAIIVSPNSEKPLVGIIEKAYDAGIPVILFDRTIKSEKYTAMTSGDNIGVGEALASFVLNNTPAGEVSNVIEIMGNMTTSPARQRHEGFLKTIASRPDIKVLASVDAHWDGPRAKVIIDSLLQIYPKIDFIVAHSDYMASSAKEEVEKVRPDARIKYIGADGFGSPGLGVFAVAEGNIDATAMYPTGGDVIMRTAIDVLEGKQVKRTTLIPSHVVTTQKEASLLVALNDELNNEVNTIMALRDKIQFYNNQLELERTLILFMIAFLAVSIALIVTLLRLYIQKRRTNEQLSRQQQTLSEQHAQLLQMTKELEAATSAKLVFFTNISHDFRTPLTLISAPIESAIKQLSQAAADKAASGEGVLHLLHIAQRNVHVLLDLVNQILDFRKIENGKMELHLAPHDLLPAMKNWHESFQKLAEQKNISMQLHADDEDWNVMCDQKLIERMVFNLIGNSMKFTPSGGTIQMLLKREQDNVLISIKDTGIGIDPKNLERIFERFYQIENSENEGVGIGLALVKNLVELMHGRIDITSNSDSSKGATGTTITIILPLEKAESKAVEQSESMTTKIVLPEPVEDIKVEIPDDENRMVVLIIDDNGDIRNYLTALLSGHYRVLTATDGVQGLQVARETVPDLIICDVMMPMMNGLECCHYLKTDMTTSHIPVLMLTACSLDEQRVKGLSEGAEAYISKPFSSVVLMAQIETLLRNRGIVKDFYTQLAPNTEETEEKPVVVKEKKAAEISETDVKVVTSHIVASKDNISRYDMAFIEKLQKTLCENLTDESFNVEVFADTMCMSRVQLYRKCKALIGETPVEMLRNTRILKAQELLSNSSMSVSEVAKAVGISDASYFTKCYKAYFGVLPSACTSA